MAVTFYHGSGAPIDSLSGFVDLSLVGTTGNGHLAGFPGLYLAQDREVSEFYSQKNTEPVVAEISLSSEVVLMVEKGGLDHQPFTAMELIEAIFGDEVKTTLEALEEYVAEYGGRNDDADEIGLSLFLGEENATSITNSNIPEKDLRRIFNQHCSRYDLGFHNLNDDLGQAILAQFKDKFGSDAHIQIKKLLGVDGMLLENTANGIETDKPNLLLWCYEPVLSVKNYDIDHNLIQLPSKEDHCLRREVESMATICETVKSENDDVLSIQQMSREASAEILKETCMRVRPELLAPFFDVDVEKDQAMDSLFEALKSKADPQHDQNQPHQYRAELISDPSPGMRRR